MLAGLSLPFKLGAYSISKVLSIDLIRDNMWDQTKAKYGSFTASCLCGGTVKIKMLLSAVAKFVGYSN